MLAPVGKRLTLEDEGMGRKNGMLRHFFLVGPMMCKCGLGLGYSFLAFIFLSDVVLYSPLSVNVWIPVGIFIIRCFDSQERELPTLSENLVFKTS